MFNPRIVALFLSLSPASAAAAWPDDHLDVAEQLLADVVPAYNEYSAPSVVSYQDGALHVSAVCGGFVAELLKATYDPLDDDLMSALFDDDPNDLQPWSSPDSTHYYRAFLAERVVVRGAATYALVVRDTIDEITAGDLLAAEYFDVGTTGHTMIVRHIDRAAHRVQSRIPGHSLLDRHLVHVIDASASVHMNKQGTTDTRYMSDVSPTTGLPVNDRGLGSGHLHLYADPSTRVVVGWSWSVQQTVPYQDVDPTPGPGVGQYRPIVAGRIVGPGL